jgi:ABC-type sugar transport system ATPase subunit
VSSRPLIEIDHVSKRFGGVTALNSISLNLEPGRIYGLAGENGAGKSTLVKILCGVHARFDGSIRLDGQPYSPTSPAQAEAAGLRVFHQEIPICPNLSVAANVFLGPNVPQKGFRPDWRGMESRCEQLFHDWLGMHLDPRRLVRDCTVAERQLTLLVRVLSGKARIIILDEPTTALTPSEVTTLFGVIRRLQSQGIAFLFIGHLLDELIELSDEIFVLRDGGLVSHLKRPGFDPGKLASLIAGRTLAAPDTVRTSPKAPPKFQVQALSRTGHFEGVSFEVATGEVLGITGLQGSGRTALARALFAAPPADSGEIRLNGTSICPRTPGDAMRAGIGYVPEDRQGMGLFGSLDIERNLGLARLDQLARWGFLRTGALRNLAVDMRQRVQIKMSQPDAPISSLSGGNQQKVLISRWLAIKPQVLVLNEPTRGVDVGSKDEICRLIRRLADEGSSYVVSSSDLDELMQVADRILVMSRGRLTAELTRGEFNKQALIEACHRQAAAGR